jgi:SAM-dependent methyltransferase
MLRWHSVGAMRDGSSVRWAAGMHAVDGRRVDESAYDRYIGRWSRLFLPDLCAAARIDEQQAVLEVASGTGEAALAVLSMIGSSGVVVGVDISTAMVEVASSRLGGRPYFAVAGDAEALPFASASFDVVVCQWGLMFFPNPSLAVAEWRRVLRDDCRVWACVIGSPERAPMWGILADVLSRHLPDQAEALHMSVRGPRRASSRRRHVAHRVLGAPHCRAGRRDPQPAAHRPVALREVPVPQDDRRVRLRVPTNR